MSRDFEVIRLTVDEESLLRAGNRVRNQLVGCMHAHNELSVLNRIFMFSLKTSSQSEPYACAHSIQSWCVVQVLAGKLFETWSMLIERFLNANPADPAVTRLPAEPRTSLDWLKDYFGVKPLKDNALRILRNKTAFHYDKLNLEEAVGVLGQDENAIYLAEHPANSLYYLGSSLVFGAVFAMIADKTKDMTGRSHEERVRSGFDIAVEDAREANWHLHQTLYGLVETLLEDVMGRPLSQLRKQPYPITDAPKPSAIQLPVFIDMG